MAEGGAGGAFRPPKPWQLTESETINTFANWKSNVLYNLSLNNEFAPFLDSEWSKKSVSNRGLLDVTLGEVTKTAVQRAIVLDRMLGLIVQFVPSLLRTEILKRSTSLSWIWNRLRKHYSFSASEVNFLKLSSITKAENERYETFYQRIVAHIEDNLLTVSSGLLFEGTALTDDEEMSPTTERLAVYLWLTKIDERLPAFISRVYAHDLQSKSLKDIQPQLAESMDSLLTDLAVQDEVKVNFSRSKYPSQQRPFSKFNNNKNRPRFNPSNSLKSTKQHKRSQCLICKSGGRNPNSHDTSDCWFVSKFEKLQLSKALRVETDDFEDDMIDDEEPYDHSVEFVESSQSDNDDEQIVEVQSIQPPSVEATCNRVDCDVSPFFYAFYNHLPCHIVIDSGATSSLISKLFVTRAGIPIKPTRHSARGITKTSLVIHGEVNITLSYENQLLPLTALVIDRQDCDILVGVPFCKENDVIPLMKKGQIMINGSKYSYGKSLKRPSIHEIFRVESFMLRNSSAKVILPGDYYEFTSKDLHRFNGEIVIEPHTDSPLKGNWPAPIVSRVIQGTVRIQNDLKEPVPISKSQHLALIRRVADPSDFKAIPSSTKPVQICNQAVPNPNSNHSESVVINPDNYISSQTTNSFKALHHKFDSVFNPMFGSYNDASGLIRAKINLGKVAPPPHKSKIPLYKHSNLQLLQEEFDKLEALGVLAKPEDVGVDIVYSSPSLLVKKPLGGYRLCTAFNELSQYTRILPTASTSPNEVLRKLSRWKYMVKSDLTKSFYQIPVSKSSMKFLGTSTPFKGLRVYTRSAMGMPGSSEYLNELMSRVLGDFVQEGFVIIIADDIYVCGNTEDEVLHNWERVLERLLANNLSLSASKTVVCPIKTTILGWQWNAGTLTPCVHKISALAVVEPPKTCSSMRSFIGAFKALSKCIPKYASLVSPLEDSIKGLQGQQKIQWNSCLNDQFDKCRAALKSPEAITIPNPSDRLVLTLDASVVNKGLGGTLFVIRGSKRLVGGFFSFKLNDHQMKWLPCELEALAITSALKFFAPYIRESLHKVQILTDSKACYEAYLKLNRGNFSASNRISTFLTALSSYNVEVCHLKGVANLSSDFASRHPKECHDPTCQICKFVQECVDSVVQTVTVQDVVSGQVKMPFMNESAWRSAQRECPILKRAYAHLTQGTRPQKKSRNIRELKRYLQVASISDKGTLIVKKSAAFVQSNLIVVPHGIANGLISALHLQFGHPTHYQLNQVFDRYFYAIGSASTIKDMTDNCDMCNSLKKIPNELREQNSSPSSTAPGQQFSADIIRRCKQKIFTTRDVFSSFTTAALVQDETASSLRSALLSTTSLLRQSECSVRVDGATGFVALKDDILLKEQGIALDYGRVKNPNKNPVIDKGIQELEKEFLKAELEGKSLTSAMIDTSIRRLNSRIRHNGLSAREIITKRDQITGYQLEFTDEDISKCQNELREQNHLYSSKSKAKGGQPALKDGVQVGDLVFIKNEGNKFQRRPQYIVSNLVDGYCMLQKMSNGKFMSRLLKVPVADVFKVAKRLIPVSKTIPHEEYRPSQFPTDSDDSDYEFTVTEFDANNSIIPSADTADSHNSNLPHDRGIEAESTSSILPTNSGTELRNPQNENSTDPVSQDPDTDERRAGYGRPKRTRRPPLRLIDELSNQR